EAAGVARPLQQLGDSGVLRPQRHLGVAADVAVTGVESRHQGAPRRGADGAAGVAGGELDPVGGELVEVRRLDLRLSVAAEVAVAEVVGEDEYDIGRALRPV